MTTRRKRQEPQRLTTTQWQRFLDRMRQVNAADAVMLRSCPVVTVEVGLYPVLAIECPRQFLFDLLRRDRDKIAYVARDVLDVRHVEVWLRVTPDAKCTRLSNEEWIAAARARARRQLAANETRRRGHDSVF